VTDIPAARPASTVVLLRDTADGLQTLLLRRNRYLIFAGGAWVFPGGALDPEDICAAKGDALQGARIAAVREAKEESGLAPRIDDMVLLSHWTTPIGEPRRYSTWIWAAPLAEEAEVVIDGSEIHAARWLGVREAAALHEAGELDMLPPTYFTLLRLARYDSVTKMVASERASPVPEVFPVFARQSGQVLVMFRGDAGYDSGDSAVPGARHRAVLGERCWHYQYSDVDPACPPLIDVGAVWA